MVVDAVVVEDGGVVVALWEEAAVQPCNSWSSWFDCARLSGKLSTLDWVVVCNARWLIGPQNGELVASDIAGRGVCFPTT